MRVYGEERTSILYSILKHWPRTPERPRRTQPRNTLGSHNLVQQSFRLQCLGRRKVLIQKLHARTIWVFSKGWKKVAWMIANDLSSKLL